MMTYEPVDVVLIPFPFTDFSTTKQRPALVISSHAFNQTHNDIIVVAITSQRPNDLEADELLISNEGLATAGLSKPSKIKSGKIVCIDKRLVRKTLGTISQNALAYVIERVIANLHRILKPEP